MNILVLVEHSKGNILGPTKEAVNIGTKLASKCDGKLSAAVLGHNITDIAEEASKYVNEKVYTLDDEKMVIPGVLACTRGLCSVIEESGAKIIIAGDNLLNSEILPRVAIRLEGNYLPRCTTLDLENSAISASRGIFEEKLIQELQGNPEKLNIITLAPGAFSPKIPTDTGKAEIVNVPLSLEDDDLREEPIEEIAAEKTVDITKAKIIVSGGRGVGSKEKFDVIFKFKDFLGGSPNVEVGASRLAVDADWILYDHEVGQTGTIVSPDIYIASGISGAFQHVVGMKSSKTVIAINTDAEAPIFDVATYGIVGDLHEVIPILMEKLG